jgi:hypothetical protein
MEMDADAKKCIAMMKVKLQGRNPDDILNMNQTEIPYFSHASKMLDKKGKKTFHEELQ